MSDKPKHPGGRPREHDRDAIALDLIEWSKLDTSTNLNGFCASRGLAPSKITDWARECEKFRGAYEEAKAALGQRRETMLALGTLHTKAYDLNAAVYDHFLKDERRSEMAYESDLRKGEEKKADEKHAERLDGFMKALSNSQNQDSARKRADKSTKTE